ncbi:hypothetical protein CF319_g8882 [Tilletia indica]|nr:hypothetical protein CF319_g8882 [Tilletia indica]
MDEELEDEVEEIADMLDVVESDRYLHRERKVDGQRTSDTYTKFKEHLAWSDEDFRRGFRVTHAQLDALLVLLKNDEIFRNKPRGRKQCPLRYQLLLVLWRLAHSRTGASSFLIAKRFGVSGE